MIRANKLTKQFGDLTAVNAASFAIPAGAICGFIGPNGAGKTTTLRMLATLEAPTHGDASIDGWSITERTTNVRREIGFMPDYCGTYPHMTTADFLDFFARTCGLAAENKTRRINELVDFLDLGPLLARSVETLSKGQKQRLSLGRAMLSDPSVLILDEPAAGLDPRARIELYELLKLLASDGTTVFLSSHILSELTTLVTWAVVIEAGTIRFHGAIGDLNQAVYTGTRYAIELTSDLAAAKRFLMEQPSVLEVQRDGESTLLVRVNEKQEGIDELFARLIISGARARQLLIREKRLEEVFLEVTEADTDS